MVAVADSSFGGSIAGGASPGTWQSWADGGLRRDAYVSSVSSHALLSTGQV